MVTRIALGGWIDRADLYRVCAFATLVYVGVLLGTGGLTSARMWILGCALGLGHGVFLPAFSAMNLQRANERDRGKILAVVSGGFNVGLALGTLGLGRFAAGFGYAPVFDLAAVCILSALGLFLAFPGMARWSPSAGPPETETPSR